MHRSLTPPAESIAILGCLGLFVTFAAILPSVWLDNVPTLLRDISWLGLIAIGQAMLITSGEFDLSVGSVFGFTALVFVLMLQLGLGAPASFLVAMAVALGIGALNGVLSWVFGLPSLLVTLGFLFVYRGLIQFFTGGFPISIPETVRESGLILFLSGTSFGLHNSILICAAVLAVATFTLGRTRFGAHLLSVGGDLNAAKACGVPVAATKIRTFMICSGLAGLAGIVAVSKLSAVTATSGEGLEFEAIAAAVIGGCSLRGGVGSAWGALLGVATLMSLKAGLILMGVNMFIYQLLLGAVLVGLIAIKGVVPMLREAK